MVQEPHGGRQLSLDELEAHPTSSATGPVSSQPLKAEVCNTTGDAGNAPGYLCVAF